MIIREFTFLSSEKRQRVLLSGKVRSQQQLLFSHSNRQADVHNGRNVSKVLAFCARVSYILKRFLVQKPYPCFRVFVKIRSVFVKSLQRALQKWRYGSSIVSESNVISTLEITFNKISQFSICVCVFGPSRAFLYSMGLIVSYISNSSHMTDVGLASSVRSLLHRQLQVDHKVRHNEANRRCS